MELEKFIEKDIQNYLDELAVDPNNLSIQNLDVNQAIQISNEKQLAQKNFQQNSSQNSQEQHFDVLPEDEVELYAPSRDYESDIKAALADGNISKAKQIIKTMKETFNALPKDSPEKEEMKSLVQQAYSEFREIVAPDLAPKKEFSNKSEENHADDWDDVPSPVSIPDQQQKMKEQEQLQEQARKLPEHEAQKQKEDEIKSNILRAQQTQTEKKEKLSIAKLHENEKKKLLFEKQQLLQAEAEQKALLALEEIKKLNYEGKPFEAISKYQEFKRSMHLENMQPERRQAIFESFRHLYSELHNEVHKHYEKQISKEGYSSESAQEKFRVLVDKITNQVLAKQKAEAIKSYKSLLQLYKDNPELANEKKKIQLLYQKIKNIKIEKVQEKPGKSEKPVEETVKQKTDLTSYDLADELLLKKEIKRLKGRP